MWNQDYCGNKVGAFQPIHQLLLVLRNELQRRFDAVRIYLAKQPYRKHQVDKKLVFCQ